MSLLLSLLLMACGRTPLPLPAPEPTPISRTWRSLSVGYERACAIDPRGTLWCWPAAGPGAGLFTNPNAGEPFTPKRIDSSEWSVVSVGPFLACALKTDGSLWCLGRNASGILGPTLTEDAPLTHLGDGYVDVTAGSGYACALTVDGAMDCFGAPDWHENLTLLTPVDRSAPRRIAGHFRQLASSWYETAALTLDGKLLVAENDDAFVPWAADQRFRDVAVGWGTIVAQTEAGALVSLKSADDVHALEGAAPFSANDGPVTSVDGGIELGGWYGGLLELTPDDASHLVRLGASHDGVCFERSIAAWQDDVIECAFRTMSGFDRRALTFP
ncbi:MAG: hypothetical protein U0228_07705 [Myxococcaceae bacterium]